MDRLDQAYLTDLVVKTQMGSSNAFAELFAATGQRCYSYICAMQPDPVQAAQVLEESMRFALQSLPGLTNPELYLPWISRICFRHCLPETDSEITTPAGSCSLSQLMQLPLVESQVLLMHYGQGFSLGEVGDLLNFTPGFVRRCLKSGQKRLQRMLGDPSGTSRPGLPRRYRSRERLDALTAAKVLDTVLNSCGWEENTVPMEALSSYAVYRKERFSLQRSLTALLLALFFLLPLLFLRPGIGVQAEDLGERGLPVYEISIRSLLPVTKVTARLRSHSLPVYEAGARTFTVEPTRNGELSIRVELINRQSSQTSCTVTAVDAAGPRLVNSEVTPDAVRLFVEDDGIGVNYQGAYALSVSGTVYEPLSFDAKSGELCFPYPEEDWDVYIPDYIGNTLHLSLTWK